MTRIWKERNPIVVVVTLIMLVIIGITGSNYWAYSMALVAIYATVGIGFNVALGVAGQVTFGQVAFMAIGAYANALLTVKEGFNPWLALLCSVLVGGLLATVIYLPFLRLRGHYLAMGTLALALGVQSLAANANGFTGGAIGISGIPTPTIGSYQISTDGRFMLLTWVGVGLSLAAYYLLVHSHIGRSWRAIAAQPDVSASLGVPVARRRLLALVMGAMMAALSGALLTILLGYVGPGYFDVTMIGNIFFVMIVGGARQLAGPIIGAAVVIIVPQQVSFLGSWQSIVILGFLIVVLIVWPTGVLGDLDNAAAIRGLIPNWVRSQAPLEGDAP